MEMKVHCKYDALVSVADMVPHEKNRNVHPAAQVDRLAKILVYQGVRAPIVVSNRSGCIVKGHGTLEAIKKNGWTHAPVVRQDFDNAEQEYLFVQSDNGIASWADLDLAGINMDIGDLGPFDLDLLGIENFKVDVAENAGDPDHAPAAPIISKTKVGDIFILGNHRLMCGDSAKSEEVERLMAREKASMCFTDPPYGVSYQAKNKMLNSLQPALGRLETPIHGDDLPLEKLKEIVSAAFKNIYLSLANKSSYYITAPQGGELGMMMMMMQESGIPCRHMIVWVKNNAAFSMGRLDYDYRHEPILYGWSKDKTHEFIGKGEFKNSVWEIDRENNKLHPTMKPVAIIENAILNSTTEEQKVIDLFGGSGSTLIACEKTNRKCFMMEIDPVYCDVILTRWQDFSGKKAYHEDGRSWDEIKDF